MENKNLLSTILSAAFLGVVTFLAILPLISAATDDPTTCQGYGMMNGLYGGYGTGFMILSWVVTILITGLIIAGIYWFIKSANKKK